MSSHQRRPGEGGWHGERQGEGQGTGKQSGVEAEGWL